MPITPRMRRAAATTAFYGDDLRIAMKLTIKSGRMDRGHWWIIKSGERYLGAFGYTFLPANTGHLFSRNHGAGFTTAYWHLCSPDGSDRLERVEASLPARTRNQADKLARAWFRAQDCRRKIAEHGEIWQKNSGEIAK